ncbi:MAG: DUF1294 domain-containing protein [bacterium]
MPNLVLRYYLGGGITIIDLTDLLWLLVAYNVFAWGLMGYDKYQACRGRWRVSERTLFAVAFSGGSAGILAGMFLFRHKIRHLWFMLGIPAILILQSWLLIRLLSSYGWVHL